MAPRVMPSKKKRITGNLEEAVRVVGVQLGHVIHGLNIEIPITDIMSITFSSSLSWELRTFFQLLTIAAQPWSSH
jgi:hypothetical protein